ncbi:hypothetical protein GYMLUDRAFT_59418 [Collybiopsis luxurians FD-317 M1]|uniref:Uncharacterized protein n=1 Tax=Collybiopsis luxurians FD-317 M1 TaxID=944289 RepID=A0A0D0BY63_9AGAR|nr:hypothetical protein GYMLUDRAFT_59418 [Collybiopsis luxurians FD-317 M1]
MARNDSDANFDLWQIDKDNLECLCEQWCDDNEDEASTLISAVPPVPDGPSMPIDPATPIDSTIQAVTLTPAHSSALALLSTPAISLTPQVQSKLWANTFTMPEQLESIAKFYDHE